jgi:hypothetical protein
VDRMLDLGAFRPQALEHSCELPGSGSRVLRDRHRPCHQPSDHDEPRGNAKPRVAPADRIAVRAAGMPWSQSVTHTIDDDSARRVPAAPPPNASGRRDPDGRLIPPAPRFRALLHSPAGPPVRCPPPARPLPLLPPISATA